MASAASKGPRFGVVKYSPDVFFACLWKQHPYTTAPDVALLAGSESVALRAIENDAARRGLVGLMRRDALASAVARQLRKCFRAVIRWENLVAWISAPAPAARKVRPVVGVCPVGTEWRWAAWDIPTARHPIALGIAATREEALLHIVAWLLQHGETWDRATKDDARAAKFFAAKTARKKRVVRPSTNAVDLRALGLSWPASINTVRKAYRERAFTTHPDRNEGRSEEFLKVRAAYESAMRAHGAKP